jgi:hypothetical protein
MPDPPAGLQTKRVKSSFDTLYSMFDVGRSMFDVRVFQITLYVDNATRECQQTS